MAPSLARRHLMRSFVAALALVVGLVGVGHADEQVEQLKLSSATVVDIGPLNAFAVSPDGTTLAAIRSDEITFYRDGRKLASSRPKNDYLRARLSKFDATGALKIRSSDRQGNYRSIVALAPPNYEYRLTEFHPVVGLSSNGTQLALKTKRGFALRSFDSDADLREFEVHELKVSGSPRFYGVHEVAIATDGRRAAALAGRYPHINCLATEIEPSRVWFVDGREIRLILDESQVNRVDPTAAFHWEHIAIDTPGDLAVVAGFHESRLGRHSCLRVIPLKSPGRSTLHTFGGDDFIRSIDLSPNGKKLAVVWRTDGHVLGTPEYQAKNFGVAEARDFVRVYAVDGLKPLAESPSPILAIRAAALTRDGKQLVVARDNGQVLAWPLKPVE